MTAKCPDCKEELTSLLSFEQVYHVYEFDGEDFSKDYETDEDSGGEIAFFACPHCKAQIEEAGDSVAQAKEFLAGKRVK